MRLLCILAVLVVSTATALAGECDDATGEQALQTIEKYAKDPKAKPAEVWGLKWPIVIGKKQLGKIDLVEEAFKMEPLVWDSEPALLYIKLDDPRAMPRLIAGWKAQLAAKKQPRASWELQGWARFRGGVARFLGKHGGAPEKAFLEEQLAVTHDPDIAKPIRGAVTAIDQRAAAPAKP